MVWFLLFCFLGGIQLILYGVECIDILLYGAGTLFITIGIIMELLALAVVIAS
jgi:hypothetical protein